MSDPGTMMPLNPQDQEQNYRRAMMGRMLMNQQQPQGSSPWASLARAAGQMGGAYMMHPYLQAMQRLTGGQDQRGGQSPPQMGAPPLGTPGNGVPGNNQSTLTPGQGGVGQLTPPQMPLGGMGGQSPQGYPQAVLALWEPGHSSKPRLWEAYNRAALALSRLPATECHARTCPTYSDSGGL